MGGGHLLLQNTTKHNNKAPVKRQRPSLCLPLKRNEWSQDPFHYCWVIPTLVKCLHFNIVLPPPQGCWKCTGFLYKDIHHRAACNFSNLNSTKSPHIMSRLINCSKSGIKGFRHTFTCDHLPIFFLISHTTSCDKNGVIRNFTFVDNLLLEVTTTITGNLKLNQTKPL